MTDQAQVILDWLKQQAIGRDNAVTIDRLCVLFQITERRMLEKITEEIREASHPLCSATTAPMGLYLARTTAEFLPYYRQIDNRIAKMSRRRKRMYDMLVRMSEEEGSPLEMELSK